MLRVYGCITDQHDLRLVAVAAMICLFACFTAFSLTDRAQTARGYARYSWLATGALITGCGVWATHFVAMLAFQTGLPASYDVGLTALSVLIAVVVAGLGLFIVLDWKRPLLGGAVVGLAIAAMHFVGTEALDLPARRSWDLTYVASAVLIGAGFGSAALAVSQRMSGLRGRLLSTVLLTLGICGMHFTAMAALSFTPDPFIQIPEQGFQSEPVAIGVIAVAVLIVVAGLIGSVVDQRHAHRAVIEAETQIVRLKAADEARGRVAQEQQEIIDRLRSANEQLARTIDENKRLEAARVEASGAHRRSSEILNRTLESMVHPVLVVDTAGKIIHSNPAAARLFGSPVDVTDLNRRNWLYRPDGKTPLLADEGPLSQALRGEPMYNFEFVRRLGGIGESLRFMASSQPIRNPDGTVAGAVAVYHDITATRAAELQLRQALKMEAIGTLAGGVAHELNNLLQPIIMMTELVAIELPEESTHRRHLDRVIDAGAKAAEIVQRILAFGRTDEASHALLDVSFVTREAISFIHTILPASIKLNVEIDNSVGAVRGDKTQLTQVLLNLATNARDAIGANVGTVWVSLSKANVVGGEPSAVGSLGPGAYAVLAVRDTGAGMDKATVERIFEPFFTTKGVGKGTGLGLSVTHGIIKGHGGAIHVDSAPGRGTSFSIYLPVAEAVRSVA